MKIVSKKEYTLTLNHEEAESLFHEIGGMENDFVISRPVLKHLYSTLSLEV